MSVISNNTLAGSSGQGGAGGYAIERSLRFNSVDSAYLSKNFSSAGNRKTWTLSFWTKRCFNSSFYQSYFINRDNAGYNLRINDPATSPTFYLALASGVTFTSTAVYKDFSAWMHVVIVYDSTDSTSTDRVRLYINGERQTFSSGTYPGLNLDSEFNNSGNHGIGYFNANTALDAYLADYHFIDGQALAPTDFGEYDDNNVWQPKKYGGTFGPSVDQSQTWSSAITGTYNGSNDADNLFDGNTSNQTIPATGTSLTFTPSSAVTGITKIRIKLSCDPLHTDEFKVNGVDQTSTLIKDSVTRDLDYSASQLTSIVWSTSSNNHWIALKQISVEVNGSWVVLVDSSVTIPNNSFLLDFSDTSSNAALGTDSSGAGNNWSVNNLVGYANNYENSVFTENSTTYNSSASGTDYYTGTAADLFDNNISTQVGGYNIVGSWLYFRPDVAITGVTSLEIYGSYNENLKINGTDYPETFSATNAWVSVSNPPSTISEIAFQGQVSSSAAPRAGGIKVNGTVLTSIPLSALDSMRDSPTNGDPTDDTGAGGEVSGNYVTYNPLKEKTGGYSMAYANGNLELSGGGDGVGTFPFVSGKKYFELTIKSAGAFAQGYYGIVDINQEAPRMWATSEIAAFRDIGAFYGDGSTGAAPAASQVGDVIGFAVDVDNQKLFISINGTYLNSANPAAGTGFSFSGRDFSNYAPLVSLSAGNTQVIVLNAGQRPFAYAAPSGYKALCTANLSDPTIADGSTAFDTKLYAGNNSTQSITTSFAPDLVWLKKRSGAAHHHLYDTVRGVTKRLQSSTSNAESTAVGGVTAFNSDGWTMGNDGDINGSSATFVGWAWNAGSSNTTIAAGGLNSSVYNQSAVWSGMCSPAPSSGTYVQGFDGNLTSTFAGGISAGSYFTFTPTGGISFSNTIRVYNGAVANASYKYNGGSATSFPPNSWTTVASGGGTMTTFAVTRSVTDVHGWYAIEVDGKLLVDQGLSVSNVPSIASTVRANPSAGFSIVSYTGTGSNATVGHGLNAAPEFMFLKNRDGTQNWQVYHSSIGPTKYLNITSAAAVTNSNRWQDTAPTSSVFSIGTAPGLNTSTAKIIAYCFAPVEGYSAFSSYTGNGSADGPFVYTGFRPRFVMTKASSASGLWNLHDTERSNSNPTSKLLWADSSSAEVDYAGGEFTIDCLSNGFKLRASTASLNTSGVTYIYAAFAENPFKTSRAR